MRIVHEVHSRFMSGGGCTAYPPSKGKKRGSGFSVEVILAPRKHGGLQPREVIYIEVDAKYVLDALRDAVAMIEDVGHDFVKHGKISRHWKRIPR
jgi:hypothetical protein